MAMKIRSHVVSAFKMHGLTLRSEASKYLQEVLQPIAESQRETCIERLLEAIQKQPLQTTMIDRAVCENAVQECNEDEEEDVERTLSVIDTFNVPRLVYNNERKKFLPKISAVPPSLFCDAENKAEVFRERYTMLFQRTARHELFAPAALGSHPHEQSKKFQIFKINGQPTVHLEEGKCLMLRPVEYLLGSTAKLGDIIVLGMLSQMKEGKWYLEDNTGAVQLDLSKANFHTGLFTENCFVLAEGTYEDQLFHVHALGFPPPETAKTTRSYFGNVNFFGGPSALCAKASQNLRTIEQENEDAMFVFLSDVWLDNLKVMEKLRTLFTGYSEVPPTCFVLSGNFLSKSYGGKQAKVLKECLHNLADLLAEFPAIIQDSKFIFVPGPQDPGPAHILPRPPIPECLTEEFRGRVSGAVFTNNPCRLQYCTQEMVVMREDLVMKMCRNCVRFPAEGDIPTHFAKTVIGQSHLCPLPLHVAPLYWSHDNALRLYPLPDLIVCADKYDPFTEAQADCSIINPGSFPRNDWSFKVFMPANRQVEDSRIDD